MIDDTSLSPPKSVWPLGGYAPGGYMCKCGDCGDTFDGDKRAIQCLPCAITSQRAEIEELRSARSQTCGEVSSSEEIVAGLDTVPSGPVNCTYVLRRTGKPYPRTCERCRLGPCPFYNKDGTVKP